MIRDKPSDEMTELQQYNKYICRINIRPEYNKASAKSMEFNGKIMELQCQYLMDENDIYLGEYIMTPVHKNDIDVLL